MAENDLMQGGYSIFHGTMADMTYPEVAKAAADGAVVLWGLGVIEQHGPHLPLATDVYMPAALLRRVKQILEEQGIGALIMPPFYWGVNHVTGLFPGTFEVRPEIMIEVMVDLIKSLKKDGFSNLFSVSGHGDALHNRTMHTGLKRGGAEAGIDTYFVGAPSFFKRIGVDAADANVLATASEVDRKSKYFDIHAGEFETSSMWGFYPDLIRKEVLPTLKSTDFTIEDLIEWRKGREEAVRKTPHGYLGDPAASDPKMGAEILLDHAAIVAEAIASKMKSKVPA